MIKSIYVFKKNGLCLFHKNFTVREDEPHTYTGFFSAINLFSMNLFNEKIQTIATGNSIISFRYFKDNIFAIVSDKQDAVDSIFKDIITNFLLEYTPEKDEEFKCDGRVPEFEYLDVFLENCIKVPTFQKCY